MTVFMMRIFNFPLVVSSVTTQNMTLNSLLVKTSLALAVTKQNPTKISEALLEMTNLYIHNIQHNPSKIAKNGLAVTYCCVIKDHILSGHVSMKDVFFKMLDQCSL